MADEELGTGSVRIELDDTAAVGEVADLGDRLEAILDRASQRAGRIMSRNLAAALRATDLSASVDADTAAFQAAVARLDAQGVTVPVDADLTAFRAAVARLGADAVTVAVRADVDAFNRSLRDLGRGEAVRLRVEADLRAFGHSLDTLGNLGPVRVNVVPDIDRARFQAAVDAALAGLDATVTVNADLDDAAVQAALDRIDGRTLNVTVDVDRGGLGLLNRDAGGATASVGKLSGAIRGLASSFGGIGAIGGLAIDLKNLAGAAGALPAVIGAAGVAIGTLKLATAGLGEAFGTALTGSADEFSKALENMTPAAQKAATEIRGLKPGFDALKASVQGAFLAPLSGDFAKLGAALSPLEGRMKTLAGAFGQVASEALKAASTQQFGDSLKASFDAVTPAVQNLSKVVAPLGQLFTQASQAVTEAFGGKAAGLIDGLAAKLQRLADSDTFGAKAVAGVEGFSVLLKSLGELASNVGGILSGIFKAADAAGAESLTGILGTLLGVLNDFVNSAPVQQGLTAVFQAFNTILPVVAQLASAVGSILGPAFAALATALGPVVTAIADALAPVIPPLVQGFQTLVTALTPIVTLIGTTLAQVISAAAPLLTVVAEAFAQIAEAIAPLIEQIGAALVPIFAQLAPIISQLVAALTPLIAALVEALLPILPPIVEAFLAILNAVLPLLPPLTQLATTILGFATNIITALAPVLQFVAGIVSWTAINVVVPIIETVVSVLNGIIGVLTSIISAASSFVTTVVGFFSNFSSNVSSIVSGFVSTVTSFFSGLWSTASSLFSSGVSTVVGFVASLPGRARSAISGLLGAISSVVTNAWNAAKTATTNGISQVVTFVRGLPGKAKAALGGIAGALVSAGADLIRGFINGIKSMAGQIASAAKNVVKGAIDGAKSLLKIGSPSRLFHQFGKWTGEGFVNGLTGEKSKIEQTAKDMVDKITKAFKGIKSNVDDKLIKQVRTTSKRLQQLADQRDSIAAKIKQANEFAAQTSQAALQSFSLQNLAKSGGGVNGLVDGLDAAVSRIKRFNNQINDLAKRGVRKDLLSQIIGLGPDQGAQLADQLSKASDQQIADLNEAQRQLDKASKKLGKDSADVLFDAGGQAAKGFLAGLKGQQKEVEDLMLSLAKGMAKAIRKALGIKSPSTVFRQIGRFTMDGLAIGVDRSAKAVRAAVAAVGRGMATAMPSSIAAPSLARLEAVTQPFGDMDAPALRTAAQDAITGRAGRDGSDGRSADAGKVVNLNVTQNLHQINDTEDVARRAVNRLVAAGGLL